MRCTIAYVPHWLRSDSKPSSRLPPVIHRKTPEEIEMMAAAGRVLVRCHEVLRKKARPGVTTAGLEGAAGRCMRSRGGEAGGKGCGGGGGGGGGGAGWVVGGGI